MSIATEITRLQGIKSDIRTALVTQGITTASSHNMADFSADILAIQGGSEGIYVEVTCDSEYIGYDIILSANESELDRKQCPSSKKVNFFVSADDITLPAKFTISNSLDSNKTSFEANMYGWYDIKTWNGELYDAGNEYLEFTGGWSATVEDRNTSFSKNTDNMSLIRNSNSGNIMVFTNKAINVTNYKGITVKYKSGDNAYISLSSNRATSTSSVENAKKLTPVSDYTETTIDISSITDSKYIGFYCNEENTSINIMKVILIKNIT